MGLRRNSLFFIIGGVVIFSVGGLFLFKKVNNNHQGEISMNGTSFSNSAREYVFISTQDNAFYLQKSDGTTQFLVKPTHIIGRYLYNPKTQVLAYLEGDIEKVGNGGIIEKPHSVMIKKGSNPPQKILEYPYSYDSKTDRNDQIRTLSMSDDGKFMSIGMTYDVKIFDFEKGKLIDLSPSNALHTRADSTVFSYGEGFFSPDNTKFIYYVQYYEGGTYHGVDLATNVTKEIPYSLYGTGSRILGWFDNQRIVVVKTELTYGEPGELINEVQLVDYETLNLVKEKTLPSGVISQIFKVHPSVNTALIFLITNNVVSQNEDQLVKFDLVNFDVSDQYKIERSGFGTGYFVPYVVDQKIIWERSHEKLGSIEVSYDTVSFDISNKKLTILDKKSSLRPQYAEY